jgi:hypothetical protein
MGYSKRLVLRPEIEAASFVMIGSFNPLIFQPRWLATQGLIRQEEADSAKPLIIQQEIAHFSAEWFELQVLADRFTLVARDAEHLEPARDLVLGLMRILPHTPVSVLGLNKLTHTKMPSEDIWHKLGHLLAPKDHWDGIVARPGMRILQIQGSRPDLEGPILRIKVEPSLKVTPHGVYIEVNQEHKSEVENPQGCEWALSCIQEHWDSFLRYAKAATHHICGLVK